MKHRSRPFTRTSAGFLFSRSLILTFLILLIINALPYTALAQYKAWASPKILKFPYLETGGAEQNWDIVQDPEGLVYVANQDGDVLVYDGSAWQAIPVSEQERILSLAVDEGGKVYVGTVGDFGLLETGEEGQMRYRSLCDTVLRSRLADESFWNIDTDGERAYFFGTSHVAIYDPSTDRVGSYPIGEPAVVPHFVDGHVYAPTLEKGIMAYAQDKLVALPGGDHFAEAFVFEMERYDENFLLVCTMWHGIHLWNPTNGDIVEGFPERKVQESLVEHSVVSAHVDDHNIFLGTQYNGIYILDREGRLVDHLSTSDGLMDNSITGIFAETGPKGGPIWLAHFNGVSLIDLGNPLQSRAFHGDARSLSGQSTSGFITDICEFNGELFVSNFGGSLFRRSEGPEGVSFDPVFEAGSVIYDLQVISPPGSPPLLLLNTGRDILILDAQLDWRSLNEELHKEHPASEVPEYAWGQSILYDPTQPSLIYSGEYQVLVIRVEQDQWTLELRSSPQDEEITDMIRDRDGVLWIQGLEGISRWDPENPGMDLQIFGPGQGLPERSYLRLFLQPEKQGAWLGGKGGFYLYDEGQDRFIPDSLINGILPEGISEVYSAFEDSDGELWISLETADGKMHDLVVRRDGEDYRVVIERQLKQLSRALAQCEKHVDDGENGTWFIQSSTLHHFSKTKASEEAENFSCQIRRIEIDGDHVLYPMAGAEAPADVRGPTFPAGTKIIEISHNAPYFPGGRLTHFSYRLLNFDEEWSAWQSGNSSKLTGLKHGSYEFQVRARNLHGDLGEAASFAFAIARPWYISTLAVIIYVLLALLLATSISRYTRSLKKRARVLARKNHEIARQKKALEEMNEAITTQRDEIEAQRDSITRSRDIIEAQKTAITDSIHYARRIQDAVLPSVEVMRYLLPNHFVFYRPQQIVSGDFFWIAQQGDQIMLALGDCTGHGVPGAFMSMLGISILNEIADKNVDRPTNDIMDELRKHVISSLGQTGEDMEAKDGMDMGLLIINTRTRMIQFTGAHHNLHLFRKGQYEEIKGDRMPVGIHIKAATKFQAHNLQLEEGDTIYLFSDGFPDQFGGERGKKYGYKRLRALLAELQGRIMNDQLSVVREEFKTWQGEEEQVDDVLLIGIQM